MENRFFQWIVGESRGNILVFDKLETEGEDTYIVFKDGSRINERLVTPLNETNLTNKFMAEIDSPNNCWKFEEIPQKEEKPRIERDANTSVTYEIPSADDIARADLTSEGGTVNVKNTQKRSIKLIPPNPTIIRSLPKNEVIWNVPVQKTEPVSEPIPEQKLESNIDETDPVYILMSKSKKQDAEINMSLVISLPSRSLYNIAKESFEGGDQKFVEYIIHNVSVEEIKKSIKEAIINMYEQTESIDE